MAYKAKLFVVFCWLQDIFTIKILLLIRKILTMHKYFFSFLFEDIKNYVILR